MGWAGGGGRRGGRRRARGRGGTRFCPPAPAPPLPHLRLRVESPLPSREGVGGCHMRRAREVLRAGAALQTRTLRGYTALHFAASAECTVDAVQQHVRELVEEALPAACEAEEGQVGMRGGWGW